MVLLVSGSENQGFRYKQPPEFPYFPISEYLADLMPEIMWWYHRGKSEPNFWNRARLAWSGPYPRSEIHPSRKFRITILISTQMICISVNM